MKHTQNASNVECSSQKTQITGEDKSVAENNAPSCSRLKQGNEPAFPGLTYISWNGEKNPEGISIRDYFAAAALQGLLSEGGGTSWDDDAKAAYRAADAMIKARESKP